MQLLETIRNSSLTKMAAAFLSVTMVFDYIVPGRLHALTSGPTQPEVQGFTPVSTKDMVDLFTGDFSYNIPLMSVGDYPLNISYHSGVKMDEEASWVGLGWSFNVGDINRSMRGLPDDFSGDRVTKRMKIKNNWTAGITGKFDAELFGFRKPKNNENANSGINWGLGLTYNSYNGVGFQQSLGASFSHNPSAQGSMNYNLGLSASGDGLSVSPSVSFSTKTKGKNDYDNGQYDCGTTGLSVGATINSRSGLKELSLSATGNNSITKKESVGGSIGTQLSFGMPTYVPSINMEMNNLSVTLSIKFGGTLFGFDGNYSLSGFYSEQRLASNSKVSPGFGYLHSTDGSKGPGNLLDFNRSKDGVFMRSKPNLALASFTYDIYNVCGQGIGGTYRPFLNSIGTVFDNEAGNTSTGFSIGGEWAGGNLVHAGLDMTVNDVYTTSGRWSEDNELANILNFGYPVNNPQHKYEPYYFKQLGEKMVEPDDLFFQHLHGREATNVQLDGSHGMKVKANKVLVRDVENNFGSDAEVVHDDGITRMERAKRNQTFSILTAHQASAFGLEKNIRYYDQNNQIVNMRRFSGVRQDHHISEITVTRTDGSRYIYGIPAYNTYLKETTFSVAAPTGTDSDKANNTGLISYKPGKDDSERRGNDGNGNGIDNYVNSTETPPYSHSFLLTAVVSSDYSDLDGIEGPSDNDFGTWTKFNYFKIDGYQWKTPYETNMAYYDHGLLSDERDDKGSIVEGTKEIWYLHSIETKNYVAVFSMSDRIDGVDLSGTVKLKRLDSISLYPKKAWLANHLKAIPIKVAHFKYSNQLCPDVPNNINFGKNVSAALKGKLTLTEIWFTYQNSKKGNLNKYHFSYGGPNPHYFIKGSDRWGNYKPNDPNMPNAEFPYSVQDSVQSNLNATAWNLDQIVLPSGGIINVKYESDDYAFVQDKRAMRLINIEGFSQSADEFPSADANKLFTSNSDLNLYAFFKIEDGSNVRDYLFDEKGQRIDTLYFKCLVNTVNSGNTKYYEYVSGYTMLDKEYGEKTVGNTQYGYIKLKKTDIGDREGSADVNPISKAAWQFAQLYQSDMVQGNYNPGSTDMGDVLKRLAQADIINQIIKFFKGANRVCRDHGWGKEVNLQKSFFRLYAPNYCKRGGGCRVAQLTMNDNWKDMTNQAEKDFEYGQEYDYSTQLRTQDSNGHEVWKRITSGVAAYEPMIGIDDNPCHQPVFYKLKKNWKADEHYYIEKPMGEAFFPAPSVGYSKVTVRNICPPNVKSHATGMVIHEFYTVRDFPVFSDETVVNAQPKKTNAVLAILKINAKDFMTASQGYMVELPDMNGTPKAEWVYAEGAKTPISGVEYFYKKMKSNPKRLDNQVKVITKTGKAEYKTIGVDCDFVLDARQEQTVSVSLGINGNLASFLAAFIPGLVPTLLPSVHFETNRFRSIVSTKVVNVHGIMDSVVNHDLGSTVSVANLAWDGETGEVLMTRTYNDFNDYTYNFNYPAHWAYDRMGPAYRNLGDTINNLKFYMNIDGKGRSYGTANITNADKIFVKGDELGLEPKSPGVKKYIVWVLDVNNKGISVVNKQGNFNVSTTYNYNVLILRSGRRNQANMSVGSLTTKSEPIKNAYLSADAGKGIINAAAREYSEIWQTLNRVTDTCMHAQSWNPPGPVYECCPFYPNISVVNPYVVGLRGNWRLLKEYAYLTDRVQYASATNNNTDIRADGNYQEFNPFWIPNSVAWNDWIKNTTDPRWIWKTEVTKYSPFGVELENVDALGRYTSAIYGYNNTLPIAVASNAMYKEIGYEGYEDYDANVICKKSHFSFENYIPDMVRGVAHTGWYSLKVPAGQIDSISRMLTPRNTVYQTHGVPYVIKPCDLPGTFSPHSDLNVPQKYVISFWVREGSTHSKAVDYKNVGISVKVGNNMLPMGKPTKSKMIDDWQQFEYNSVEIPASSSGDIVINLFNNGSIDAFFDDVRIFPVMGNMKSFVYDNNNFRLMAELDANNYATFYEYNEEGKLVRVKIETAKGIMTVKEANEHLYIRQATGTEKRYEDHNQQ